MPHELLFARHGHSHANRLRVIANRAPDPYALTAAGRAQARDLRAALREYGRPLTAIYASPLTRAVQTAAIIAAPLGLPVAARP